MAAFELIELTPCAECGMPCQPGEFHPFAACLMFKGCGNSATVRANLAPLNDAPALLARIAELEAALRFAERHCPCGARPESPATHPHVPGCLIGAAMKEAST